MNASAVPTRSTGFFESRNRQPIRSWSDRIDWLLVAGYHFSLGGLVGATLFGCVAKHSPLSDAVAVGIVGALYLWNARHKGYI
nr:hypothetical protein [uncultured Roseateles sp.]